VWVTQPYGARRIENYVLSWFVVVVVVVVVSGPCSTAAFSFVGPFFVSKLFVNVTPDIVLFKSMHASTC
jgi:hypothetical protein